jgi:hypothetical protein
VRSIKSKPITKESERETVYVAGCHIDKEIIYGLLDVAKALKVDATHLILETVRRIKSHEAKQEAKNKKKSSPAAQNPVNQTSRRKSLDGKKRKKEKSSRSNQLLVRGSP